MRCFQEIILFDYKCHFHLPIKASMGSFAYQIIRYEFYQAANPIAISNQEALYRIVGQMYL